MLSNVRFSSVSKTVELQANRLTGPVGRPPLEASGGDATGAQSTLLLICQCISSIGLQIANQVCRYVTLLEASGGDATGAQSTCQEQETLLIHIPPMTRQ